MNKLNGGSSSYINSLIVQLLAFEKLNGDNYAAWKSNLNTILVVDDLRFILTEECPQIPASNVNQASRKAYDRWIKANEKARVYILASMSDVLAKKHESLATAKEIMDSLKGMFRQPEWYLRHEAIKYIYTKRMKEGTSVREHVLDMMMHFNIAEVNGGAIDEANQVSFILESLPKSFIPFQMNASLNKIEFNLTTLLNELQCFQNLTKGKGKEVEANVATTKGKFKRGSSSKSKSRPLKPNQKIEKKEKWKTPKQTKGKKTTEKEKEAEGKYDLLETSSWKRLSEGKITLKVGTGEMVSAKVVGDLKLFFNDRIGRLVKTELLKQLEDNSLPPCDSCLDGKMTKRSFTRKGLRAKILLELVHSDLYGSMNVKARGGYKYFISFINDYTSEAQIIIPDDGIEDPLTYKQAMNDVDCDQWIKSMDLEMESMYSNSVWTLVDQPSEVRPIGCKWIYKRKRDQAGKVQTFKARLVAKDYTQKEGIDYEETFSPVAMIKSISILLSITTFYDYEIWQMDVKTAFLNGNLEESIYMVQPEGFIQKGKKQKNVDEPCVYKRITNSTIAFLVLYVDDILLIGNEVGHLTDIKEWLATQFQMKDLEDAQYVLGIQIVRNRKNKTLAIYGIHLSKEQCPKTPQEVEDMSNIPYASAVGSLMYAMLCTRPDICYSVGIVSRYQPNPGRDHWTTVKNILKYLRRTKDYILVYGSEDLILTGYTNSNFQTNKDARKSTSGSVFTLNGGVVVWRSIKQSCIVDSTMEAEYVATCEAAKEAVWLKKFLTDLEVVPNMHLPITLYCGNSGAVAN
ncbi:gag/pol protein [Cucumis melo var. makuwa]|uniref:Gag/pol protein n=1 Tax=Cucumis melo var. makuwa TaxID=1194695 RepID=A0A5D3BVG4_CUCMM|nr:gag/pol protein [Cucumis melo var. makuwa]